MLCVNDGRILSEAWRPEAYTCAWFLWICSFGIFEHPDAQVLCSAYGNIFTYLWPYPGKSCYAGALLADMQLESSKRELLQKKAHYCSGITATTMPCHVVVLCNHPKFTSISTLYTSVWILCKCSLECVKLLWYALRKSNIQCHAWWNVHEQRERVTTICLDYHGSNLCAEV